MANRNPNGKGVQPAALRPSKMKQPVKSTSLSIVFVTVGMLLVASFIQLHSVRFGAVRRQPASSNCFFRQ
jgi:hypothetical protein